MSEPIVTTGLTSDPVPPDPAIERERRIRDQMETIRLLEANAANWRSQRSHADRILHHIGAELTKARQELARLVSRE